MSESLRYTSSEILTILSARQLKDGQVVFAGIGIPLLAATLAQRLRCPGLTILFEGGVIGAFVEPGKLPPSTNDQRCTKRANMVLGSADVLLLLQRGYVDVGFMGGAQIDQYGNLNSSFIGHPQRQRRACREREAEMSIASLTNMIVAMKHEKRRLRGKSRFHHKPRLHPRRHDPRGKRTATWRHVPRHHRACRCSRFRRRGPPDESAGAQSRHHREQVQDNTGFDLIFDEGSR